MTTDSTPQGPRVSDLAISLIRTWVPIAAGSVLAWLATRGWLQLPTETAATVGVIAAGICAAGYYSLARALEALPGDRLPARVGRRVGRFMLGGVIPALGRQPVYVPPPPPV